MHAYRRDIADIALAGQLFAPHYARPLIRRCGPNPVPVLKSPSSDAETITDLAPGDEFAILEISGGWAWGYRRSNHNVGYVPVEALVD